MLLPYCFHYTGSVPPLWHLLPFIHLLVHSPNIKHLVVRYCARHWGQSVEQAKALLAWAYIAMGVDRQYSSKQRAK